MKNAEIGEDVVRTKGDYVVGRTGKVVAIDVEKNRAQIEWKGETKTWVSFDSLEPISIPYEIIPMKFDGNGRRNSWPKYVPKSILK